MTAIGRAVDAASAYTEAIKRRGLKEVRSEHTREVVRQDLPEELRALIIENAQVATQQTLKIAQLEHRIADLERALGDIARQALAKASEAA